MQRSSFNPNVHGARGLFSLMVFCFHVHNSGLATFGGPQIVAFQHLVFPALQMGVELFFGISGIVIVAALPRAGSLPSFLWDRATRIFPVLWVVIFPITAYLLITGAGDKVPSLGLWLANFLAPPPFFKVPLVHLGAWSLGYEFTFYLLAGAGYFAAKRGVPGAMAVTIAVGIFLLAFYPRAILMASGALVALGLGRHGILKRLARYPATWLFLFLLVWRTIDWQMNNAIIHTNPAALGFAKWLTYVPELLVGFVFGTMAMLAISEGNGPFGRFLRSRPMMWLGTISYSFYLWHPLSVGLVKAGMRHSGLVQWSGPGAQLMLAALSIGPALIASHYSQVWLEVRATSWLRRRGPDGRAAKIPVAPTVSNG